MLFKYDLSIGGQFLVTITYNPRQHCTPLSFGDRYIIMCTVVGVLAAIYQVRYLTPPPFINLPPQSYSSS